MHLLTCLIALLLIAAGRPSEAVDVQGRLVPSAIVKRTEDFDVRRTSVYLGDRVALVQSDSSFVLWDVAPGEYTLQCLSDIYAYPSLTVSVTAANVTVYPFTPRLTWAEGARPMLKYPIELSPTAYLEYQQPTNWQFWEMLKSPMVLMMLFGVGMAYIMPKMMQNLDPEALEEMKAQQAEMAKNNPFSQIQETDLSEKLSTFFGGSTAMSNKKQS